MIVLLLMMKGGSIKRFANMFMDFHDLDQYSFKEFKRDLSVTFQPANIYQKAKQELATLRQKSMKSIEEFLLWFQQCLIEVQYNIRANGRFLIQLLWNAIRQDLVEFIKISQIHLIDSDEFDDWVHILIQAKWIKTEQKAQKSTLTASFDTPARSWNTNPRLGTYVSLNYKGKNPIANFWQTRWSLPLQNPLCQQQFTQTKPAPLVIKAPQWTSPRHTQKGNAQSAPNLGLARITCESM